METALKELQARTDTRGGERVERTLAPVSAEVELYSGVRRMPAALQATRRFSLPAAVAPATRISPRHSDAVVSAFKISSPTFSKLG
jgi:hypothetical protein